MIGPPASGHLSLQRWVDDSASALLKSAVDDLPRFCDAYTPHLFFLLGSALDGELCGIVGPAGEKRFLSDIDLGFLTKMRIPPEVRERIAGQVAARARERAGDGPAMRIGFYYEDDLATQDPLPGLIAAVQQPRVLWGDPGMLHRFRLPSYERIPSWEARRLLANRSLEWVASQAEDGIARVYAAAKLIADGAAVALFARGAYRGGGFAARCEAAGDLEGLAASQRDRIAAWTAWRLQPRCDSTPLGGSVDDAIAGERLATEVCASVIDSMRFVARTDAPDEFLGRGVVRGRAWARSWKRWLRFGPGALARLGTAPFVKTPRVLLWEAALWCALGRREIAGRIIGNLAGRGAGEDSSLEVTIAGIGEKMNREEID